jgi:hypothetical protein
MITVSSAAPACTRPTYQLTLYQLVSFSFVPEHCQKDTTYLHITKPIKIHIVRKLLLNRPRRRTTRPSPQIITLPILIFLAPVHSRRHTPDDQIAQHDDPAKHRGHIARYIRLVDAKLVGKDGAEVEYD